MCGYHCTSNIPSNSPLSILFLLSSFTCLSPEHQATKRTRPATYQRWCRCTYVQHTHACVACRLAHSCSGWTEHAARPCSPRNLKMLTCSFFLSFFFLVDRYNLLSFLKIEIFYRFASTFLQALGLPRTKNLQNTVRLRNRLQIRSHRVLLTLLHGVRLLSLTCAYLKLCGSLALARSFSRSASPSPSCNQSSRVAALAKNK